MTHFHKTAAALLICALFLFCLAGCRKAPAEGSEPSRPGATVPSDTDPAGTGAPATVPSETEPSVTEPPVTDPPATEPPVTEPPATEPPVTAPPATDPPATEPPAPKPPVTEPPAPPVTEPPAPKPPVTEPPVTKPAEPSREEKRQQALVIAREIARNAAGDTDLERVAYAAAAVADYCARAEYTTEGVDYREAYGVFIKGEYSCAGATRALGMVLEEMGFKWTHANENQWSHQWCILTMDGEIGFADGQIGLTGYGKHPVEDMLAES